MNLKKKHFFLLLFKTQLYLVWLSNYSINIHILFNQLFFLHFCSVHLKMQLTQSNVFTTFHHLTFNNKE